MSFIEKSVARLDQLETLEALALELGKSHYHYNAPPQYYSVRNVFPTVLSAVCFYGAALIIEDYTYSNFNYYSSSFIRLAIILRLNLN